MSKIVLVILMVAALGYAVLLVLFRRPLPDPRQRRGLSRRFILATLLFVGLLTTSCVKVQCYMPAPSTIEIHSEGHLLYALSAVWQTLDPNQAEAFRRKLQDAVHHAVIRQKTADMLAIAYAEIAFYKQRTRVQEGQPVTLCYKPSLLGSALYTTRENALKQLVLLEAARQSGRITEETAVKAHAVLARDVEMLYQAKDLKGADHSLAESRLLEEYQAEKLIPSDSAVVAGKIIVEMEEGRLPDLTPAKRLLRMRTRVHSLFTDGGVIRELTDNDMQDPVAKKNLLETLQELSFIYESSRTPSPDSEVTCYMISLPPPSSLARRAELAKLQKELLDKNVQAGVLSEESGARLAGIIPWEPAADYATEADLRDYQKKVRRITRLLYKHGELTSSFVEQVEKAVDVEIITFNAAKALRNDLRWYLRSYIQGLEGDKVLKALEKRKLIPVARNHRGEIHISDENDLDISPTEQEEARVRSEQALAEFERLLDSQEEIIIPEEGDIKIPAQSIPEKDSEYRLQIRRAIRALLKTNLLSMDACREIETRLEIPIFGSVAKK